MNGILYVVTEYEEYERSEIWGVGWTREDAEKVRIKLQSKYKDVDYIIEEWTIKDGLNWNEVSYMFRNKEDYEMESNNTTN